MLREQCHGNHGMNILDVITLTYNYHVLLPPPNHSHKASVPEKDRYDMVEIWKNS